MEVDARNFEISCINLASTLPVSFNIEMLKNSNPIDKFTGRLHTDFRIPKFFGTIVTLSSSYVLPADT